MMDSGQEASSLLSLSHSLLQPESPLTPTLTSSSSSQTSQAWSSHPSSNFSAISPSSGYSGLTHHESNQTPYGHRKVFNRGSSSLVASRISHADYDTRPPDRSNLIQGNFSSLNVLPSSQAALMGSSSTSHDTSLALSLAYEHSAGFRGATGLYGNQHSFTDGKGSDSGDQSGLLQAMSHNVFSQGNYGGDLGGQGSGSMFQVMPRSSHGTSNSTTGDVSSVSFVSHLIS